MLAPLKRRIGHAIAIQPPHALWGAAKMNPKSAIVDCTGSIHGSAFQLLGCVVGWWRSLHVNTNHSFDSFMITNVPVSDNMHCELSCWNEPHCQPHWSALVQHGMRYVWTPQVDCMDVYSNCWVVKCADEGVLYLGSVSKSLCGQRWTAWLHSILFKLCFLPASCSSAHLLCPTTSNNRQQHPTTSNSSQQYLTTFISIPQQAAVANSSQWHPTTSNNFPQQSTTSNSSQQHPTTPNSSQQQPISSNNVQQRNSISVLCSTSTPHLHWRCHAWWSSVSKLHR